MREDLFVVAKVRLKDGKIGTIQQIDDPLGFREFYVNCNGEIIKSVAVNMTTDCQTPEWESDDKDFEEAMVMLTQLKEEPVDTKVANLYL